MENIVISFILVFTTIGIYCFIETIYMTFKIYQIKKIQKNIRNSFQNSLKNRI